MKFNELNSILFFFALQYDLYKHHINRNKSNLSQISFFIFVFRNFLNDIFIKNMKIIKEKFYIRILINQIISKNIKLLF